MDSSLTLLVDAPSLIYRALFSSPDTISTAAGKPINAAHGFLRMLAGLIAIHNPDYIACADDADWRPQWRVDLIDSYKSIRAEADSAQAQAEDRLESQLPVINEMLDLVGIKMIGHPEYEAEDVIGTLAARAPGNVAIFSGDRDLFQLVRDPDRYVIYPIRGVTEVQKIDESYIADKFGIPGRLYHDYAVLRGDASDGLPGVRGIGQKLAATLVSKYGGLDDIISAANGIEQSVALNKVRGSLDYIERARKVVTIATNIPIPEVDLTRPPAPKEDEIKAIARDYGLSSPMRAMVSALRGPQDEPPDDGYE